MGSDPWLIVVHREELDLFQHFEERFGELAFVDVVVDRRKGERRQSSTPVPSEQRRLERRRPPTAKEQDHWVLLGYRLVCRPKPPRPCV